MKFDRQIVAIALTNGACVLYSDDDGVKKFWE
jgi:predicted nucleic acid-binding protein